MMNRAEKLELDALLISIAMELDDFYRIVFKRLKEYRKKNLEPLGNTNPIL